MRKKAFIAFDDYVTGATTLSPTYSKPAHNTKLGEFDRFSFEAIVDDVTAASSSLDIYLEHSPDAEHWLHVNGTADNPPTIGHGDAKWGGLFASAPNPPGVGSTGTTQLFAFVRFQILFGNSTTGAHIRIKVTPRDGA